MNNFDPLTLDHSLGTATETKKTNTLTLNSLRKIFPARYRRLSSERPLPVADLNFMLSTSPSWGQGTLSGTAKGTRPWLWGEDEGRRLFYCRQSPQSHRRSTQQQGNCDATEFPAPPSAQREQGEGGPGKSGGGSTDSQGAVAMAAAAAASGEQSAVGSEPKWERWSVGAKVREEQMKQGRKRLVPHLQGKARMGLYKAAMYTTVQLSHARQWMQVAHVLTSWLASVNSTNTMRTISQSAEG